MKSDITAALFTSVLLCLGCGVPHQENPGHNVPTFTEQQMTEDLGTPLVDHRLEDWGFQIEFDVSKNTVQKSLVTISFKNFNKNKKIKKISPQIFDEVSAAIDKRVGEYQMVLGKYRGYFRLRRTNGDIALETLRPSIKQLYEAYILAWQNAHEDFTKEFSDFATP